MMVESERERFERVMKELDAKREAELLQAESRRLRIENRGGGEPPLSPEEVNVKPWTKEEDDALAKEVYMTQGRYRRYKNWTKIAQCVPGRGEAASKERWEMFLRPGTRVGRWTSQEDAVLLECVQKQLEENTNIKWGLVASSIHGRRTTDCRYRWVNYVNPT